MNSDTNVLLFIIVLILLFGSGAVLGFLSTVFWAIVVIAVIIGVIWILLKLPKAGKEIIKEEKEKFKSSYNRHPVITTVSCIALIVLFVWFIIDRFTQSGNNSNLNTTIPIQNNIDNNTDTSVSSVPNSLQQQTNKQTSETKLYPTAIRNQVTVGNPNVKDQWYPVEARNNYMKSCVDEANGATESYCECTLMYLQKNYSFNEFTSIEQKYVSNTQINQIPQEMNDAANACANN